jgi:hypothetical protein
MREAFGAPRIAAAALLAAAVRLSLKPDDATPAAVRNCWL